MMTPAESERHFDELMRRKLAEGELESPPAHVWPAVSQTLPPAPRSPRWPVAAATLVGIILGLLIGWWSMPELLEKGHFQRLRATGSEKNATGSEKNVAGNEKNVAGNEKNVAGDEKNVAASEKNVVVIQKKPLGSGKSLVGNETKVVPPKSTVVASAAPVVVIGASHSIPVTLPHLHALPTIWEVALAQDSAIRAEAAVAVAPVTADSTNRVATLIATQRTTLQHLQRQLDSLKAALPGAPPALALADSVVPEPKPPVAPASPLPGRWAVALLAETTSPWGTLPTLAPTTTADTRETLRTAASRSLQLEHRFRDDRWLVRGGFGETRLNSQFAATTDRTLRTTVTRDSLATFLDASVRYDTTLIIHLDSTLVLNPRINGAGQIIGYDSLWRDRNDTLYQVVITHDTLRRNETRKTTRIETRHERREQQLRPTYRFWTIPVAVQYDVLRWRRWRAGLNLSAQVVIFRGGEAAVAVGDGYELRRIGVREGPFRPVSLSVSTSLELRYALTDRLSVFGGGGVRGWAIDPMRNSATPRTVLGSGQVGVSWGVGKN
jgi:hypothetical protein